MWEKTRPKVALISDREKPLANGEPCFIRIDMVHQGDHDKQENVYHINAVDEMTQFEVVCSWENQWTVFDAGNWTTSGLFSLY